MNINIGPQQPLLSSKNNYQVPLFHGRGGLPINIEALLHRVGEVAGSEIGLFELLPTFSRFLDTIDEVEDYWERGKGNQPYNQSKINNNLAVWGFTVEDSYIMSEGICERAISKTKDNFGGIPDWSMYRTARRTLNASFEPKYKEHSQLDLVEEIAKTEGIKTLVVGLGGNNVLGTVAKLSITESTEQELDKPSHFRSANFYLPVHFEIVYRKMVNRIKEIQDQYKIDNVVLFTVPHVTIPPITRGINTENGETITDPKRPNYQREYYEYYTRPWVWEKDNFNPKLHPKLTREEVFKIDRYVDDYNKTIENLAQANGWTVYDLCNLLDGLSFRGLQGKPTYSFPPAMISAFKEHPQLNYLYDSTKNTVKVDTRYLRLDENRKVIKGGLFSLDGIHPTTLGYGIFAHEVLDHMKKNGIIDSEVQLDWKAIVNSDTLLNNPPQLLTQLQNTLNYLDRYGLFSKVFSVLSK